MYPLDPTDLYGDMNDQLMSGLEQSVEAQNQFLEAWREWIEESTDDDVVASGATGMADAYTIWLEAMEEWTELLADAAGGEQVDPEAARDIWLRAGNESAKALMETNAFAKLTGEQVAAGMDLQQQRDDAVQAMLEGMGLPTIDHVEEIGDRLVEVERRQHALEGKLDEIIDHVDDT